MCQLFLRLKNRVGFAIFRKYALDDGKHVQMHSSNVGDRSKIDWIKFDEDLIGRRGNPNCLNFNWFLVGKFGYMYASQRYCLLLLKERVW